MPVCRFKQVDAFSARPFLGNPVAVVLGADGLSGEAMARIARWTNLSETTFVLEPTIPGPAYRLRIFSPGHELPFAGHPTIGSCHAVIEAGLVEPRGGRLVQQCGAGDLPLRIEGAGPGRRVYVQTPEARPAGELAGAADEVSAALGGRIAAAPAPAAFCNGPTWLFVRLESRAEVAALAPDLSAVAKLSRRHSLSGIAAFAFGEPGGPSVHIRCFAPAFGVPEDPVTGSANGALPAHLARAGLLQRLGAEYVASQGSELGRDGRVHVRILDARGRTEIGGEAVTVVEGEIRL